jgi:hypothetical protein
MTFCVLDVVWCGKIYIHFVVGFDGGGVASE